MTGRLARTLASGAAAARIEAAARAALPGRASVRRSGRTVRLIVRASSVESARAEIDRLLAAVRAVERPGGT